MDAPKTDGRFLSALLRNPSDDDIRSAIATVASQFPSDAAVAADLATILAASGERLSVDGAVVADVASTGGPASLSTLLTPLFLRAAGAIVPKLGVPGRPAGSIDCHSRFVPLLHRWPPRHAARPSRSLPAGSRFLG